ncbi:MAG: tetratricopeptide repeat protein [Deltaproteobacteria bacterium]|nr:tetratricopeptide repeat protein [Deltaproteobacteria bacterium]
MATLSEQLEAIFQEIKTSFAQHQQIQVTPIAGDPPEQYRVTYHLRGFCKEDGGEVQICTDHIITITLPFGFPHFPPNCTPESPVFHPDFDQVAICIGEFWENTPSLAELIIHIGRMLCGEIYSSNNAFNEEAATWYKENHDKLPLDTVRRFSAPEEQPLPPPEEERAIPTLPSTPLSLEIVDDTHFASDEMVTIDDGDSSEQVSTFTEITTEKTFSPSLHHSSATPQHQEPGSNLNRPDQHQQDKVRKTHQEGEAFENKGQPAKALERYKTVKNLAPDFPEIDKDISRAQYSLEMLGDWAAGDSLEEGTNGKKKSAAKAKEKKTERPSPKSPSVQQERKQTSRWPAIIIGSGCTAVLLTLISGYLFFNIQLEHAQTKFEECKQLLDKDLFSDADQKCTDAMELTFKIFFIKQQEKKLLTAMIKEVQSSEKLKKGLAFSEKTTSQPEWQKLMILADTYLEDDKWKEAMATYTRTLELATEIPTIDRAILDQIRSNLATAQFNIFLQAGEQALSASEWDSAKKYFNKALDLAKQHPRIPPEAVSRIKSHLGQVEFNKLMAAGEENFSKGDWQNALVAFEQAQKIDLNFSFSNAETVASLQEVIVKTKVFNALEQGQKAFADAQWDQAISQYETAIQLLEANSEILRRDNPLQSQQKISRLMLHAAIIRDKQSVASHLKNKEFTPALNKLQAIIKTIEMSPFAKEQEFQTIIKETRLSINQDQGDILIADQSSYLTNNYQKLFTQNNPTLTAENLSQPRANFLKKINNNLLFKLQCFEQGHGRPVLLQINYIYNPATKQWHFFDNDKPEGEQ